MVKRTKATAAAEDFVAACMEEEGDAYRYGAEVEPGQDGDEWDCSELVQVKLNGLGIPAPDGSQAQYRWCEQHGEEIPLEEGIATRGALLFRVAENGHVAVSLGDGRTIEALGTEYGVGVFDARRGRTFNRAARVPGLDYSEQADDDLVDEDDEEELDDELEYDEGAADDQPYEPAPPEEPDLDRPALSEGSRGTPVKRLQRTLQKLGLDPGRIDGIFGERTGRAVRKLQKQIGETVDGIVGKKTRRHLWSRGRDSKSNGGGAGRSSGRRSGKRPGGGGRGAGSSGGRGARPGGRKAVRGGRRRGAGTAAGRTRR